MNRVATAVIAICMVIISGAFGAVLYRVAGLTIGEAAAVSLAMMLIFVLLEGYKLRERDRAILDGKIEDLNRFSGTLAREVQHLEERMALMETGADHPADRRIEGLSKDLSKIDIRLARLTDIVAEMEEEMHTAAAPAPAAPPPAIPVSPVKAECPEPVVKIASEAGAPKKPDPMMIRAVQSAIEGDRIDLHLQPIVTLPQRKVRYYEALARLRGPDGELIRPGDFLPIAEELGVLPSIDNFVLFRGVQVLRRLAERNRDLGLFCNIALATVLDHAVFQELHGFLEANRALADRLVLEFSQKTMRTMGPVEIETLTAITEFGFRYSVDQVRDLKTDFADLSDRGVRFIKVNANLLLNHSDKLGSDIHPADLADLLARHNIELIADHIENEATVVDLLDYDLKFAQGFLFSPPKPVRAEVLQGLVSAEPKRAVAH